MLLSDTKAIIMYETFNNTILYSMVKKLGASISMKYNLVKKNNFVVYIDSEEILVRDTQSALDLMMTVNYETNCRRFIIDKKNICEEFFRLSSGLAGDILQKFINYHIKIGIVGDFLQYTSKPLHDFIYECNNGNDIFFVDSMEQAVSYLTDALG